MLPTLGGTCLNIVCIPSKTMLHASEMFHLAEHGLDALAVSHPLVRCIGHVTDRTLFGSLLHHARIYIHGHSVGGINPSLLEAMRAGSAIAAFDTPFNRGFEIQMGGRDKLEAYVRSAIPMGRFGNVEEVADAIVFLASDKSSFMTGHAFVVDGGECL